MKIVIVNKHYKDIIGGSEIQCDIIAEGLTLLGHDVHYLAVEGKLSDYNVNYSVHSVISSQAEITNKIRELSPDIIYWRSCRYLFHLFMKSSASLKIPIVFAVSNKYDLVPRIAFTIYGNKLKALKEFFLLKKQFNAIKKVNGVTVLNPEYLKFVPNKSNVVVLNAMRNDIIPFNWPRPYCAWVSNFKDTKRPELFIELAKRLEYSGIDFIMVGRSNEKFRWVETKEKLPVSLHFLGEKTVEEVNGILNSSLFQVHTCLPEGFGNIFIQAWLNRKPSLSLDHDPGGFIKMKNLGFNANGDFELFVASVQNYIKDANLREAAGIRALEFAEQMFSPKILSSNVEKFLLHTLGS